MALAYFTQMKSVYLMSSMLVGLLYVRDSVTLREKQRDRLVVGNVEWLVVRGLFYLFFHLLVRSSYEYLDSPT